MITEQAHAPGCDLKLILHRYTQTGQLPIGNTRGQAQFMDCPDPEYDFQYMQNTVKRAESEFYNLPLEEQAKHDNNPSEWLRGVLSDEFIDTPADTEADAEGGEAPSEASPDVENNGGKEPQSGS
jgi:hypothetical protein